MADKSETELKKLLAELRQQHGDQFEALLQFAREPTPYSKWQEQMQDYNLQRVDRDMRTIAKNVLGPKFEADDIDKIPKRSPRDPFRLWEQDWSTLVQQCASTVQMMSLLLAKTDDAKTKVDPEPKSGTWPLSFLEALACVVTFLLGSMNLAQQAAFERAKKMGNVLEIRFIVKELASTISDTAETVEIKAKREMAERLAKRREHV